MVHQLDYWNQIIIFAIFAMSLNLVQGYAGQTNIAQAAFGAIGGYGAALLSVHAGAPFLVAAVVAIVIGFVAGVLLSIPALGVGINYVILLTLAFAYIVTDLLDSVNYFGGETGILGVKPINIFGQELTSQYSIFALYIVIGVLVLAFCWRIGESGYGRVLKGLREDEAATRSLGKNTLMFQTMIFGVDAALAALAGVMFAFYFGNASPSEYSLNQAILYVIMVVIGGSGNLFGSIAGAILITASTPVLEDYIKVSPNTATYWQQVVYGIALIAVMLFRPAGLFPEHVAGRPRWWTRLLGLGPQPAPAPVALAGAGGVGPVATTAAPAREMALATGRSSASSVQSGSGAGRAGSDGGGVEGDGGRAGSDGGDEREPGEPSPAPRVLSVPILEEEARAASNGAGSILQVKDLAKSFGGIRAVQGVTMDVPRHQVTALIGPNGAGKSTLFGLWTGFMRPDAGSIKLKDVEIRGKSPSTIAGMGMVRSFQDVRLFRYMTCLQNVMLGVPGQDCEHIWRLFATPMAVHRTEKSTREQAMELLQWVGMAGRANDLAADLSHGEQKLVAIARVLATNAELLLLDEPTSGIDPEWVERVAEVIRDLPKFEKTVCVVEHNLGFLQMLNADCYFMEAGRIVTHGSLDDLMADEELRRAYFGV
jgi:branched-chain amino acid transport system permease protein